MIAGLCRGARNAAIFAIAAVAGCVAIGRALPLPEVPQVKEKLDWFRAHRGDYTALFLGTSRVRRHIIPSLFDRLAAEHGMEMRSFNLGVDSLAAPEDEWLPLRDLAAQSGRSSEYLAMLVRKGRLEATKRGARWYSTAAALARYEREVAEGRFPAGRPRLHPEDKGAHRLE